MTTNRLIVDLTSGPAEKFDAEVARIQKEVDERARGQVFEKLAVGVITFRKPDVMNFPLAFSSKGRLGQLMPIQDVISNPGWGSILDVLSNSSWNSSGNSSWNSVREAIPTSELDAPENNWQWTVTGLERAPTILTGRGVKVGVIDSGADGTHAALEGRIAKFAKVRRKNDGHCGVATVENQASDPHGHGTQVTSVVAGVDPGGGRLGVAPGCTLYVADISRDGTLAWEDVQFITAVEWMAKQDVRVLNISLVYQLARLEGHDIVLRAARRAGMLPIVAIGNVECGSSTTPGNSPEALSVGAMSGPKTVAELSGCRGTSLFPPSTPQQKPSPRLLAPGQVRVAVSQEGVQTIRLHDPRTSFATPFVAGIAALLLEACPTATNAQLEEALLTSSTTLKRTGFCSCPAAPVVNFESALAKLRGFGLDVLDVIDSS